MTKRCINGHYYDGDKFARCPYCGAGDLDDNSGEPTVPVYNPGARMNQMSAGFPNQSARSNIGDDATVMLSESQKMNTQIPTGNMQTETANDLFPSQSSSYDGDATKSIPLSQISKVITNTEKETKITESQQVQMNIPSEPAKEDQNNVQQFTGAQQGVSSSQFIGMQNDPAPQFKGTQDSAPKSNDTHTNYAPEVKSNIGQMVQEAKASGNTFDEGDAPTQRLTNPILHDEPTVGWLIGVSGKYYGECFELRSGKNFIGRAPEMDVVLAADKTVSRQRHAVVLYEPHSRTFFAQAGESRELFYLNEKVVLKNEQLSAYDTLLIGTTKLVFFPLCGSEFSWDDVKEE